MFKLSNMVPNTAKGFQITFANGYTVSVQWGCGNYCENYGLMDYKIQAPDSATAETAIIGPGGKFHEYKGDDVQGYQTPEEVLETLNYAASINQAKPAVETGSYGEQQVLESAAGFYIGTLYTHNEHSDTPGLIEPGSRDSHYFNTEEEAGQYLAYVNG